MYKEKERKSAKGYKEKRNEKLKRKHFFSIFSFSYQKIKKEKYRIVLNRKKEQD